MKNLFSILFISIIFSSCSEERILIDEVIYKNHILYYHGEQFTGIVFDVFNDDQLKYEIKYQDGKKNGLSVRYFNNGDVEYKFNYKDGKLHGKIQFWNEQGDLMSSLMMRNGIYHDPTINPVTGEGAWSRTKIEDWKKHGIINPEVFFEYFRPPYSTNINEIWFVEDYIELQPDLVWQWKYNQ